MTPRYFTRAAKPLYVETPLWASDEPQRISPTVTDHEATDTGLVDSRGDPIMRAPNPIGFVWD